ncbi:hypothetical protein [Methylocapsa acidiphila]|uniref:hypothetical protein n=1 Tax=Methylocapsa acidiphila TaxID=133552 RepID=UPI000404D776|nr:hypothetical protein [Methylocapsa acidiphila]
MQDVTIPVSNPGSPNRRRFIAAGSAGAAFGALAIAAGKATIPADAELLALGAVLEKGWKREKACFDGSDNLLVTEEVFEKISSENSEIVDQIIELRAETLAGLKVKARAFLWCRADEIVSDDVFKDDHWPLTRDMFGAARLLQDLLAI